MVPDLVIYKCIQFYYIMECFDACDSGLIVISNNGKSIRKLRDNWGNSTFGKYEIKSKNNNIYEWHVFCKTMASANKAGGN